MVTDALCVEIDGGKMRGDGYESEEERIPRSRHRTAALAPLAHGSCANGRDTSEEV